MKRLFAEGPILVRARFRIEILAAEDDWPDVVRLMRDLAEQRGLSFQDLSLSQSGAKTLALSISAPGQPLVLVNDIEWNLRNTPDLPRPPEGEPFIRFAFFGDVPASMWQPVAADLISILDSRSSLAT